MSLTNFNHPSWRRVISQLREIFNELHLQVELSKEDDKFKTEHINLSDLCLDANQKYINIIEKELQLMGENTEEESAIKESFRIIHLVWKLCNIIFIKSSPSGTLLVDLQEWYRSTNNIDPMVQELISTYASSREDMHTNENYWLLILLSVAQGRIDTARYLIAYHPLKDSSVFKAVDEQLRTMPNFATLGHLSMFEFKAKWEYWQKKCIQVLTTENFMIENTGSLEIICKMLCADEKTFLDLKPIFNNWYYMLISFISYSNPTFNISDLHLHLASKTCMKQFEDYLDEFDAIIHNIFDFDVEAVIKDCVHLFSNNLFSAHLLDILYLNGKLQLNKQEFSNGLNSVSLNNNENKNLMHESHLSKYAVQLLSACSGASSLSLYQTAFDYLLKCRNLDTKGIDLIEAYMEKISLVYISEMDANKIFHIASQFGLHDLAFSIGRVMQTRALKRGLYGTALGWNVRIKDQSFGTILAEKILEEFFISGDPNLLEFTENLSKEIIYCDRIIFLSKYREFYKFLNTDSSNRLDSLKQAGALIVQLLEAPKLVPFKYRKRVLFDLTTLINEDVFNEEQIFSILRIIQTYENRRDFFKEGQKFNQLQLNENESIEIDGEEQYQRPVLEIINENFDQAKWNEFLNELGKRMADNFLKNTSIEI